MVSPLYYVLILISLTYSKRNYDFKMRVTTGLCSCFPSTPDQLYFRLCRNSLCSTWTSLPNGLQTSDTEYSWTVTTPMDYGTMNKVQVAHMGDDQLCLDHIKIDGIEYDWGITTYCWDSGDTSPSCKTLTVITSTNDWSLSTTNPCEYASEFDDTYYPTPIPTAQTDNPTRAPTTNPSTYPTNDPTSFPSIDPTNDPTIYPTNDPTMNPTQVTSEPTFDPTWIPTTQPTDPTPLPTLSPTVFPTNAPTGAPFGEINVEPDVNIDTTAGADVDHNEEQADEKGLVSGKGNVNYGLIMGVIFGGLFCVTFLVLIIFCYRTQKKKARQVLEVNASPIEEEHPVTYKQQSSVFPDLPAPVPDVDQQALMHTANMQGENVLPASQDDSNEQENILPASKSKEKAQMILVYSDDDMYNPSHASDANVVNKETVTGDIEMMYQQPTDNGQTTNVGNTVDRDDSDDSIDDPMYNKQSSTKGKNMKKLEKVQGNYNENNVD